MNDNQKYDENDPSSQWVAVERMDSRYQEQFNTDGRWRWRPRAKPTDTSPPPWQPGRAPEQ